MKKLIYTGPCLKAAKIHYHRKQVTNTNKACQQYFISTQFFKMENMKDSVCTSIKFDNMYHIDVSYVAKGPQFINYEEAHSCRVILTRHQWVHMVQIMNYHRYVHLTGDRVTLNKQ
jgi:hypothetical protein